MLFSEVAKEIKATDLKFDTIFNSPFPLFEKEKHVQGQFLSTCILLTPYAFR